MPAYFGAEQREATLQAARLAGLSRVQLLQGGSLPCCSVEACCRTLLAVVMTADYCQRGLVVDT